MEPAFLELWKRVEPFTMTGAERGYALYSSVLHLERCGTAGAFVECGVWKGGSALLMALTLMSIGAPAREIVLFDTFEGMPEPGEEDRIAWSGESVRGRWERNDFAHWAVGEQQVARLLADSGYPMEKVRLVRGKVEETLPEAASPYGPEGIALLRLDTDWYESTRAELEHLFPRLAAGGILIVDDYGHFTGARKAVDDYFKALEKPPFLVRVDYTGRVAVR